MVNASFSPLQFNEIPSDDHDPDSNDDPWFEMDDNPFMDLFASVFDQENKSESFKNFEENNVSDDVDDHVRLSDSPVKNLVGKKPNSFSLTSWDLLRSYGKGLNTMNREENASNNLVNETDINVAEQKLSTEEILKVAGERFIQFSSNKIDCISTFIHPYGSSLSDLSMEDARDVEIIRFLLSAAEHVGSCQRLDLASELVTRCLWVASGSGTPVQRLAFYFAEALQAKINSEVYGRIVDSDRKKLGLALGTNNTFITIHQGLPFVQVTQFAAVQTIIDNVRTRGGAKKIHLIDLQIRSGIHCTALMQGFADGSPNVSLKITAVCTPDDNRSSVGETGKRLVDFARSLSLSFSFELVFLNNFSEFRDDVLNVEKDETCAVYCNFILRSMISKPHAMENVMRAMSRLKPAIMVLIEVEANHNSPSFEDRFIEALLFYSAFFDCLEDCMERDNQCRMILESAYFGEGIMNIVAADGETRVTRSVKLDVWRAFFARFGMDEIELSESARYQASLVLKRFEQAKSCNLESSNGKGLIVGWKGTPLHSLTAWKFK